MKEAIDLNADVGEGLPREADEALMRVVTSANVACGGHAGDRETMRATVQAALECGTRVGAHPSYPDRERFGRETIEIKPHELEKSLRGQIEDLIGVARELGAEVAYIKPHGSLYNDAARDASLLELVLRVAREFALPVMLLASAAASAHAVAPPGNGPPIIKEGFIDRGYLDNGRLIPRDRPGALITDPQAAAAQALALAPDVDSLCVHSDTPDAGKLALAARRALEEAGYHIGPPRG